MNRRVNRKIKAGLVIAILLGVVLASVTIDANGNNEYRLDQAWQNKFTADDGINQQGYSVDIVYDQQGEISGFIVAGWVNDSSGDIDMYLVRTDENGSAETPGTWIKTIGEGASAEYALCIQQTDDDNDGDQDDGYIIVGSSVSCGENKLYLVKTDKYGEIEPDGWKKTFNNSMGRFVQQTDDGGYIITGSKKVGSELMDLLLMKTDADGNETWNSTYDGYNFHDEGFSVQQTTDGGYIVTGILSENNGTGELHSNCTLLKYDSEGNLTGEWIYGENLGYDVGTSVKETLQGDYILTGYTTSGGSGRKVWLIKRYANGSSGWTKIYEGEDGVEAWSVDLCSDGGYIITGTSTDEGVYILKTNNDGDKELSNIFGGTEFDYFGRSVQNISSNEYIVAGWDGYPADPGVSYNETDVFLTKIITNTRPDKPTILGDTEVKPEEEHNYTFTATDPDGHDVYYYIDWDDDTYEEWIGPYPSGEEVEVSHSWQGLGSYSINAKAKDIHGFKSDGWAWLNVTVIDDAPSAPNIEGPTDGKVGETYEYKFKSTDPEGHDVYYYIDWGDGTHDDWFGPYPSGEEATATHAWSANGTYTIRAKAKDVYDAESDWGTLEVTMPKIFGYTVSGTFSQNIKNKISGSNFTMLANGTANNITAYIQTNLSTPPKTKCMIYRNIDSTLIGTTDEKTLNTGDDGTWITFNFSDPKPTLVRDTEYILACWSDDTCNLSYDNATSVEYGRYRNQTYGDALDPINWTSNESRIYSIYCRYASKPEITNVCAAPNAVGFGFNITISADVNDNACDIDNVTVNITYPNNATGNFTMDNAGNDTYEYVFSDTWIVGQYNYTIWAVDKSGSTNSSSEHSFNISAQATISVCTIKDEYGNNETVNLTDPLGDLSLIGYELLDDGDVLHIWNKYDSYYFNTSSGIQLTNHYDEYWSHNVMMLGYYNNDEWNLIYRTDELSGFNRDIDADNETYVNATLWKDLTYKGYDFRLAIRYHLGVDDNELTVIPYIKNIDQDDIPYILGFGWEMKDIQIDMTSTGDYIEVNRTMYYLDQTLDNTYTDLLEPEFYLMENITGTSTKSLYLRWNQSLTYKLQVKSRAGQYNAPVTLFVRIGTLNAGQEKYTKMYWYDADQKTYYFDSYDNNEAWATNPSYMVDGSTSNHASTTTNSDVELCDGNTCSGNNLGDISKVEIRASGYYSGSKRDIFLRPVFGGTTDGMDYIYDTHNGVGPLWSPWFDITQDPSAPQSWSWTDVDNLDCDVEVGPGALEFTLYCSKVELRVTYTPNNPPGISNPYPADGSTGISISPMLNITVSDADGDNMNITWLSNSSGSWQIFGTNNSVGNGTYHQTFANATENGKWWYWKVNVTDGTNYTVSSVYKFYTGCQSKIKNTGSTYFKGYLLIQVQYYNNSSTWVVADDTINETSPRTISCADGNNQLGLDTIFNGLVNTLNLSSYGNGTYRIYAAFRDPDGNILQCDDETELEATYEFTITFE